MGNAAHPTYSLPAYTSANIGPNMFHQKRTVSWQRSMPRSNSKSSMFRKLNGNRTYSITALADQLGGLARVMNGSSERDCRTWP